MKKKQQYYTAGTASAIVSANAIQISLPAGGGGGATAPSTTNIIVT